jgi:hypothetical protein
MLHIRRPAPAARSRRGVPRHVHPPLKFTDTHGHTVPPRLESPPLQATTKAGSARAPAVPRHPAPQPSPLSHRQAGPRSFGPRTSETSMEGAGIAHVAKVGDQSNRGRKISPLGPPWPYALSVLSGLSTNAEFATSFTASSHATWGTPRR